MTTLTKYTEKYLSRRSVSECYMRTLRKRTAKLERETGLCDLTDVLTEEVINSFLRSLTGLSAYTVRKYRADLLAIWRSAADDDLVGYPVARRIWRPKAPPLIPECYSIEEVRRLAAAAERIPGAMPCGLARRLYWPAAIRFAWDTGLRRGDIWRFELPTLKSNRTFRIVQNKTGKAICRVIQPETLAALKAIKRSKPLAWTMCEWCFGVHFQEVREAAGLDRGSFRWLRRASGSHVEAEHPGAGHKVLGNTPQVFGAHYDAQIATQVLAPPKL